MILAAPGLEGADVALAAHIVLLKGIDNKNMENNNHVTTQVFLMLDMTGSMQANKQATIDACNEFVEGLKADPHTKDFIFSLGVFNSNIGLERVVDGV